MTDIDAILAAPAFHAAAEALRLDHDRYVDEIVMLTEIPAPPFAEDRRAAVYLEMFRAHGLADVRLDAIGNVTGIRRGTANWQGGMVAVAAHLDTVFAHGTDCTVRREGTRLYAPGVGDDTRGLAAILAYLRALDAAGIETERDLLFVGDIGEEGKGDLRGVRHLFTDGEYAGRIDSFFTVDGLSLEKLTTGGVGSLRHRATFRGPGGHSLTAFGTVNPACAMADVITGMNALPAPREPRTTYCATIFGGGTSINAIPDEVWMEVDLRSEGAPELAALNAGFMALVAQAVAAENARGDTSAGEITAEVTPIGDRPAGAADPDSQIVRASVAALQAFGYAAGFERSSTDANIPMSLGIPAVRLGAGIAGERAHSLDEWIDVAPDPSIRGLTAGLAAILGTAGMRTDG